MNHVKKVAAILSVIILLCGCELRCDICGEEAGHRVKAISVWHLCDDCYEQYCISGGLPDGEPEQNQ